MLHFRQWGLVCIAASLAFCATIANAQECVQWSKYSCEDKPKPGASAPAPDVIRLGVLAPKDAIKPGRLKLYRVDVTCDATQILPAPNQGIFNRSDLVTTHVIAITGKALTGQELPTDARVLIPVYSVSTAKANQSDFTNKACNQSFFVSGRESLFIAATANQTRTNTPSALSNLLYTGLKLFNPIAPLFSGVTAVAAVQPILDGVAATQAPLKEMFSQFDSKGTQTYSAPLYLGETNIRTPYSRTRVTVKEIPSIIQAGNEDFIVSFEDSLKGYSDEVRVTTLDVNAVAADCRSYAGQLLEKNFPAYDVAYALTLITRTAGLDKEKSVSCIGKPYGLLSVENFSCPAKTEFKCLWTRFPNDVLKADDFKDPYPIQKYEVSFFKGLRNALDAYAEAGPNGDDASRAALAKFLQDEVEFSDLDGLVGGKDGKIPSDEFAKQLVASDYTKFGCPTKDPQAAGLLFGFPRDPAPEANGLYTGEKLVVLRSWRGETGKVFKVDAFLDPGLAEATAKPTLMWCGKGLHLAGGADEKEKEEAGH